MTQPPVPVLELESAPWLPLRQVVPLSVAVQQSRLAAAELLQLAFQHLLALATHSAMSVNIHTAEHTDSYFQ